MACALLLHCQELKPSWLFIVIDQMGIWQKLRSYGSGSVALLQRAQATTGLAVRVSKEQAYGNVATAQY
jgi:hypothetical protein